MLYVGPDGNPNATIALVGEAGGAEEGRQGIPFVGPSGKVVDACLATAGLTRSAVYVTNLVKGHPQHNDITPWFKPVSRGAAGKLPLEDVVFSPGWDARNDKFHAFTTDGAKAREDLLEELAATKARIIMPLGNSALAALVGKVDITKHRGSPMVSPRFPGRIILPTIHPANCLRGQYLNRYYIAEDFQKALRLSKRDFEFPVRNLIVDATFEETLDLLEEYRGVELLGGDIETPMKAGAIYCIAIAPSPWEALVISFMSRFSGTEERALRKALQALWDSPGRLLFQNGIFDTTIMARQWRHIFGCGRRLEDTMVGHRILYPELLSGLDTLCSLYTDEPYYKSDGKEAKAVGDVQQFLRYCGKDATVMLEAWDSAIEPELLADKPLHGIYRITMDLHEPLREMMLRGFRLDSAKVEGMKGRLRAQIATLQSKLDDLAAVSIGVARLPLEETLALMETEYDRVHVQQPRVSAKTRKTLKGLAFVFPVAQRREAQKARTVARKGVEVFLPSVDDYGVEVLLNPLSPSQLCWYFYTLHKQPPYIDRKTGNPTVDDIALAHLAKPIATRPGFEEAVVIQEIRTAHKLFGTYADMPLDADGRYRCSYKPKGTKTGRLASAQTYWGTGGNHQNVPQEFRETVIPDEGQFFWAIDKKGAEWVVVAYEADDPAMIEVVESGQSPHVATAMRMTKLSKEAIEAEHDLLKTTTNPKLIAEGREKLVALGWKGFDGRCWLPRTMTARQAGKKANHGLNYREGYKTFALTNGLAETEAKQFISLYTKDAYPMLPRWWERLEAILRGRARTLRNSLGRAWTFRDLGEGVIRQAVAFIPQSTVVDITNQGLLQGWREREVLEYMLQKHDELMGQAPLTEVNKAVLELQALATYMSPTLRSTFSGKEYVIENELTIGLNWGFMQEAPLTHAGIWNALDALVEGKSNV